MKKNPLVSIVIPMKNPDIFLEKCLKTIKQQTYKNIEIVIVSGKVLGVEVLAAKYGARVFEFEPKLSSGRFDATHRRNYGVKKAKGKYLYYADTDYELTKNVIKECVLCADGGYDAVITPLDTFGTGIWARAKRLERRCYFGDEAVEAPRFFRKKVWDKLGGLDENLAGGGDDWDLYQKLKDKNYRVGRVRAIIKHNEGDLKLNRIYKKAFMYGKDVIKYFRKRPKEAIKSYFPIRPGYIKNWKLLLQNPRDTATFIFVRIIEYSAGFLGFLYSLLKPND